MFIGGLSGLFRNPASVPMSPALLFRPDADTQPELAAARRHWPVETDRRACTNRLIVGRYSVLPFYADLEADLASRGCRLVNTFAQHQWLADFRYYDAVRDLTFESWDDAELDAAPDGPFVLKGRCSSFKHKWSELMFARDKSDALTKATRLRAEPVIAQQGLLFRRYEPLEAFGTTPSGLPLANEWRYVFVGETLIARGFYWARLAPDARPDPDPAADELARECARRVAGRATFFVADVARTVAGTWKLVELNDGQTSGLMAIDADGFYRALREVVGRLGSSEPRP